MTDQGSSTTRLERPDPARGVFETLLVVGGRPIELEAHLARLERSVQTLYGQAPPTDAGALVVDRAAGIELGRLRLTLTPHGPSPNADVVTADIDPAILFPGWERAARLRQIVIAGGLGEHKWADRSPLREAEADPSGAVPLIVDRDGTVLEGSRANVFLIRGRALVTPPADGRILPGVTRARVIDVASELGLGLEEDDIAYDDLLGADEVFLTGSVRGIEPVRAVDGSDLTSGPISSAVAAGLRVRWLNCSPSR